MKAKIDKTGNLHIWRGKAWKLQDCPHGEVCGDHCALFSEIALKKDEPYYFDVLEICQNKKYYFTEFDDERETV